MPDAVLEKLESDSPEETELIAEKFAELLKPMDFVELNGPLGAGKTKFTSGIISFFCRNKHEAGAGGKHGCISAASPTYSIMNTYRCGDTALNHFDFYRLKTAYDLENCGFFDSLEGKNITVAEWTDMIKMDYKKFVGGNFYSVNIKKTECGVKKEKRYIEINHSCGILNGG
jgi:tRNA threonylcarbamoyladenosine biosynthesis protein TsaE